DGITVTNTNRQHNIHIPQGTRTRSLVEWLFSQGNLPKDVKSSLLVECGFPPGAEPIDIYRIWPPDMIIQTDHIPAALRASLGASDDPPPRAPPARRSLICGGPTTTRTPPPIDGPVFRPGPGAGNTRTARVAALTAARR